jgi:Lecithin retinol acyltransferase
MEDRFKPGDHLQVRRQLPYSHHGIYVSDDRVIQFGGGIFDKPRAKIEAVSLEQFERGGAAEVVEHGRRRRITGYLFEADEPWKAVARAEFLLKLQPKLPYNLIGHNCEHIANMCASGGYTESHQTRGFIGIHACLTWAAYLAYAKRFHSKQARNGLLIWALIGTGVTMTYHHQIKLFWKEIRAEWRAHERTLAEDPRNREAETD